MPFKTLASTVSDYTHVVCCVRGCEFGYTCRRSRHEALKVRLHLQTSHGLSKQAAQAVISQDADRSEMPRRKPNPAGSTKGDIDMERAILLDVHHRQLELC